MGRRGKLTRSRVGDRLRAEIVAPLEVGGVARAMATDGGVDIDVRGAIEGELVDVEITHQSGKGRLFGDTRAVLQPSPLRVPVNCPQFLHCGGCDLLHLARPAQHDLKRAHIASALGLPIDRVDPVLAAPQELGYRALAKLVVGSDRTLGSYKPFSHDVADMSGCLVHAPLVEQIADRLRAALKALPEPIDLRYVLIRGALAENRAIVTFVAASEDARSPRLLAAELEADSTVARALLHVNASSGDALYGSGPTIVLFDRGAPSEKLGAISQSIESGAFAQVNPFAAELLYRRVAEAVFPAGKRVIDLYSGSGGISLTLAGAGAASVLGIERSPDGVEAARRSAEALGFGDRVAFRLADVEVGLADAPQADVIVLNPPRRGTTEGVLDLIAKRAPLSLAYVSCDPMTLASNVASLRTRITVSLRSVTPVDLFPQTRHVETVVVLEVGRAP